MTTSAAPRGRAALVVLGCAKNQVEAESMSSRLAEEGWTLTGDIPAADVVVVHTCGFLAEARKEAKDAVAHLRRAAPDSFLVMTGCFAQFLGNKKPAQVDALLGTGEFHRLPEVMENRRSSPTPMGGPAGYHDAARPRPLRPGQLSTSLRLGEGCNHRCTFCIIPQLRGRQVSRPTADIVTEARGLLDRGVRELCLISQDTSDYGRDLSPGASLAGLIGALLPLKNLAWIRLLYCYPSEVSADLISLLAGEEKLCGYMDMPLQHIADPILRAMARDWGEKATRDLLDRLRRDVPHLALRTTFIVGFPGETEGDFDRLLALVKEGRFEHAGVFPYSPEERSPSHRLPGQLPPKVIEERWQSLTDAQTAVVEARARARLGTTTRVLAETSPAGGWTVRTTRQAPEVDGEVVLASPPPAPGFYDVRLTGREGIHWKGKLA
jgi:ribosomal protein S12 methylthiotransferase